MKIRINKDLTSPPPHLFQNFNHSRQAEVESSGKMPIVQTNINRKSWREWREDRFHFSYYHEYRMGYKFNRTEYNPLSMHLFKVRDEFWMEILGHLYFKTVSSKIMYFIRILVKRSHRQSQNLFQFTHFFPLEIIKYPQSSRISVRFVMNVRKSFSDTSFERCSLSQQENFDESEIHVLVELLRKFAFGKLQLCEIFKIFKKTVFFIFG